MALRLPLHACALLLLTAATALHSQAPAPTPEQVAARQKAQEERLRTDWAGLNHFRDADAVLPAAALAEPRVVFMGDSITANWSRDPASFFPGHHYIGRGISGQTTPQMLLRFRQDVIDLQPAAVVILAGTNDVAGNTGPMTLEQTMNDIKSMAELARAHNIAVVLCSVPPAKAFPWRLEVAPNPRIADLNAAIRAYAAANHLQYVDFYDALVDNSPENQYGLRKDLSADGVHPNAAGYAIMAPLAEKAIEAALATAQPKR